MPWKVELRPSANRDLRLILRHLIDSHYNVGGESYDKARQIAARRTKGIAEATLRIGKAPHIGTLHLINGHEYRNVTLDRTIYWFTLNEPAETVQIEGIFFSGQDHLGRMLSRLTEEGGGTD